MSGRWGGNLWSNTILRQTAFHLDPREFDLAIVQHGQKGEYRRSLVCPCQRVETGWSRSTCTSCRGLGRMYPEGQRCIEYMLPAKPDGSGSFTSASLIYDITEAGMMRSTANPAIGDMWLPCGEVHTVQQLVRFNVQPVPVNDLRRRIVTQSHSDVPRIPSPASGRLLYPSVTLIDACAYQDADGKVRMAEQDVEFRLNGVSIEWIGAAGPPPGGAATVRYQAPATYLIGMATPKWGTEGGQRMPWEVRFDRLDRRADADLESANGPATVRRP